MGVHMQTENQLSPVKSSCSINLSHINILLYKKGRYLMVFISHSCTIYWFDAGNCSSKDQIFLNELHLYRKSIFKEMWPYRFIPQLSLNLTYHHPNHVFRLKKQNKKSTHCNLHSGNFL